MSNEVTKTPCLEPVSQAQADAWVMLAIKKNELVYSLQLRELSTQKILLSVERNKSTYQEIDAALAEYRKAHAEMTTERKGFTGLIDNNIIQPLMEFEKRVDPKNNEGYKDLADLSLSLRKEEKERVDRINAINAERAKFKIHVENEFLRVAAFYRGQLNQLINQAYQEWLKQGLKEPDLPKLRQLLTQIKVQPVNKFQPVLLTVEDMTQIYETCDSPDYQKILEDTEDTITRVFANYEQDLANAEAAIAHAKEQAALAEIEAERKAAEEAAMNTLITTAETVKIDEPKIKKTLQITVVESEGWAKAVMAAFITNLPHLSKYIRVRSWSKLNIGQMANYLSQYATDSGVTFSGLILEEVEK